MLDDYETLARRYAPWWPTAELRKVDAEHAVIEAPQSALRQLRAWAVVAESIVAELEAISVERSELDALTRLCTAAQGGTAAARPHGTGGPGARQPDLHAAAGHAALTLPPP